MTGILWKSALVVSLSGVVLAAVTAEAVSPSKEELRRMQSEYDYPAIVKAYAAFMIEHGRDRYGKEHTPLFVSAMDRKTATVFRYGSVPYPRVITRPYAPGLRRDHKMRPYDRTYSGGNPIEDLPLYELLYRLSELTGDSSYGSEADASIAWFLKNAQSIVTGLYAWGSHLYWDVHRDQPVYSISGRPDVGSNGHEYQYVWPYWDQNPEALTRFAHGLWNHQIADRQTGRFSRHALYHKHGPEPDGAGREFPQTGSCYMNIWAREYGRNGAPEMKQALGTLLAMYRSMRHPATGAMAWCTGEGADRRGASYVELNLFMATTLQDSAALVEKRDPELARDMRLFVTQIDDEYLSNEYDKILDVAGKGILDLYTLADRTCLAQNLMPPPDGISGVIGYPLKTADGRPAASLSYGAAWFVNRSYAGMALLFLERYKRCEEKHKSTYRRAIVETADIYMTLLPEVQFAVYPDDVADVVRLLREVYRITGNRAYLHRADQIMKLGIRFFFDEESPLPKITNFDDWYESSTKNGSSVEILRQMMELSLELKALPEGERSAPVVKAKEQDGLWLAALNDSTDALLQYGEDRSLYMSQTRVSDTRHLTPDTLLITLSDAITRIPTAAEADKLNGRMKGFTGKVNTEWHIPDGGFKDVPRQIVLTLRNTGKQAARVQVTATLHDTYHDNGRTTVEKRLNPGQTGSFMIAAPDSKWIRRLDVNGGGIAELRLDSLAFAMSPRSQKNEGHAAAPATPARKVDVPGAQGDEALVFLIAGQSNAGGVAAFSPETNCSNANK